jgi:hypothetical protein
MVLACLTMITPNIFSSQINSKNYIFDLEQEVLGTFLVVEKHKRVGDMIATITTISTTKSTKIFIEMLGFFNT